MLGNYGIGPCGARHFIDSLDGEARRPVGRQQIEPVAARGIVVTGSGRFLPLTVGETEKLAPELGTGAWVRRIQNNLTKLRCNGPGHDGNAIVPHAFRA